MFKTERQEKIVDVLRQRGRISAVDLARQLRISDDTARRDLDALAAQGVLQRVHGGAVLRSPTASFHARQNLDAAQKQALAQVAAAQIKDGQVLFIDGGSTNIYLAHALPTQLHAVVFTPSPSVALALLEHAHVEVHLFGGQLQKASANVFGVAAFELIRSIRADWCVLGACGVHLDLGATDENAAEAEMKRLMVAHAASTMVLATAEKLNTAMPYVVARPKQISCLVVSKAVARSEVSKLRRAQIKVLLA